MAFDVKTTKIELSATDKTKVAFDSVRSNLSGLESGVSGLMGRFGGLVGILGVGAFATFTKRIIDQADSMNDLSKRSYLLKHLLETTP